MIKERLIKYAKEHREDPNKVFIRYVNERLLYRLSMSEYVNDFAVKGAMVFYFWGGGEFRPTKDIDLLGFDKQDQEELKNIIGKVCLVEIGQDDEVSFDKDSINTSEIRKLTKYSGVCVDGKCKLKGVGREILFQIDVGFGDIITPGARLAEMNSLLDLPSPKLRIYNVETVIAEKFEAMVTNGISNSRLKDYWDVYSLLNNEKLQIDPSILSTAVKNTFERRKTKINDLESGGFSREFYHNEHKVNQWNRFLKISGLDKELSLEKVVLAVSDVLLPIYKMRNEENAREGIKM